MMPCGNPQLLISSTKKSEPITCCHVIIFTSFTHLHHCNHSVAPPQFRHHHSRNRSSSNHAPATITQPPFSSGSSESKPSAKQQSVSQQPPRRRRKCNHHHEPAPTTEEQPSLHLQSAETLILEREGSTTCQSAIGQSNLVKYSNMVKDWSKNRGLTTNIDIFGCLCKFGLHD